VNNKGIAVNNRFIYIIMAIFCNIKDEIIVVDGYDFLLCSLLFALSSFSIALYNFNYPTLPQLVNSSAEVWKRILKT
jgi:hypothetical protein